MNTSLTGEETHSLDGSEVEKVNSAATGLNVPMTSEEVARQIRVATDPLTKQLQKLCDLKRELHRDRTRRDGGTSVKLSAPQDYVVTGTTVSKNLLNNYSAHVSFDLKQFQPMHFQLMPFLPFAFSTLNDFELFQ